MATGIILSGFLYGPTPGLSQDVPGDHLLAQGERGGWDVLSSTVVTFLIDADGAELIDADGALLIDGVTDLPLTSFRSGPLTDTQPIDIRSVAQTGARAATFLNDWYNRIHLSPRVLDLGAVTGGSSRSAVIWNAYLSDSELTTVTSTGEDSLVLTGAAPRVLQPLEYMVVSVTPNEVGPATIDTVYSFPFPDRPDAVTLTVVGRRARLWPFAPNWRGPVDVNLQYRSDVFRARSGREQRRALRQTGRRTIDYTVTLGQAETRQFHGLMTKWQSLPWLMADPVRRVLLAADASLGDTDVQIESVPSWLVAGVTLILDDEIVTVASSIDGSTVTLDTPLGRDIAAGSPVRLGVSGLLSPSIRARHPSNGTTEFSLSFAVTPGSEAEDAGSPGVYVHAGREVLLARPNWADAFESEFNWANEQVDFGFGRTALFNPVAFGSMVRRASYVQQTAGAMVEMEQFFARQRGQAGEFLMPTWMNDLPPVAELVEGTNFLRVLGTDVAENYSDDATYRAVAVMLEDGRRIFRDITEITTVSDLQGTDSVVYVDGPWLTDIHLDEIVMVSWLPVTRFSSDQVALEWLTSDVGQVALAIQTLEYRPSEAMVTEYDGAAQYIMEAWGADSESVFDMLDQIVNIRYPEITT